jgi:hypothetical protein
MCVENLVLTGYGRSVQSLNIIRRPKEQYYDEDNIFIPVTRTVICEATNINPENT